MTAHSAIRASSEIRQSASNRLGRVISVAFVGRVIVAWIMLGRVALSIVGGSRSRAALGFIAESFIIRERSVRGSFPGNTSAHRFPVNLKDSRHRLGPGKALGL